MIVYNVWIELEKFDTETNEAQALVGVLEFPPSASFKKLSHAITFANNLQALASEMGDDFR